MTIFEKMRREFRQKDVFKLAEKYAFEYIDSAFDRNVFPTEEALENLKVFDEKMPESSGSAEDILETLHRYGAPATSTLIGGRYFGFVNGGAVPAGLAARILADFWDQNAAMEVISPIASKLELVVEAWLRQIFQFPESTVAGYVSGTSTATFSGLAAARYRLLQRQGWDINEQGMFDAPRIRIVAGRHAHSTVLKAIGLLGFGKSNIEWADVDEQGRIIPERLPDLDNKTLLILQAGNVNSGAFDPLEELCRKANAAGAWVHIDGAFGLWAAACKRLKHLTKGLELAQSWSVDGHKTLNTPYDCGIVLCADREALTAALHMSGAYIVQGKGRDGMFHTPEMSRRARIIELWATMKYLGNSGIDDMIWGLHERALQFASALKAKGFQVLNDVVFNQVLVAAETDEATQRTLKKIQDSRVCWCGGSEWFGRKVIRVSVCSWATTEEDVVRSVGAF